MLDRTLSAWVRPVLVALARRLVALGVGADAVTITGFAIGLAGAACIATGHVG